MPTRGQVIAAVPATPIEWSQSIGANDGYEYLHTRSQGGEQHVILGGGRTAAPHADWGETGDDQLTFEASEVSLSSLLHKGAMANSSTLAVPPLLAAHHPPAQLHGPHLGRS